MKKKFNYAIYHRGCLDGFAGFLIAHMSGSISKNSEIYADIPSSNIVPPDIDGKDMIIIDVAYKKEILEIIFKYAKSVVFIDHHVSIRDDVVKLQKKYSKKDVLIVYDETACGSTLAWKYFFPRQNIPLFLKYIEDQDIGRWLYPDTKPFIFSLKVYYSLNIEQKNLNKWFGLLDEDKVAKLVKKGKYMKKYNDHLVNINVPRYTMKSFPSKKVYELEPKIFKKVGQYKVAVYCGLNCPSITDLSNEVLKKVNCDFCIMWAYNLDNNKYVVSMRSREVDVSLICRIFGGGGHKLAAACSFLAKDYKIDDMFESGYLPRSHAT